MNLPEIKHLGLIPAILVASLAVPAAAKPATPGWLGTSIELQNQRRRGKSCKKYCVDQNSNRRRWNRRKSGLAIATSKDLEASLKAGKMVTVSKTSQECNQWSNWAIGSEVRHLYLSLVHTKAILDRIAHGFYLKFRCPLKVTSLSRTAAYVRKINATAMQMRVLIPLIHMGSLWHYTGKWRRAKTMDWAIFGKFGKGHRFR